MALRFQPRPLALRGASALLARMPPDRLREKIHASPFVPFVVEMMGGKRVRVKGHDYVILSPAGRTLIVYDDSERVEMLDVSQIKNIADDGVESAAV